MKLLIVDDEPAVLNLTSRILSKAGFEVLQASSGDEALRLCKNFQGLLALVVTDVNMPGMNGKELARCISQMPQPIPVILMSGDSNVLDIIDGRLDNFRFIVKPFIHTEFLDLIRRTLNEYGGQYE
jgi:two-component system cell cycle sensor histidine kinase/response regulator CckA